MSDEDKTREALSLYFKMDTYLMMIEVEPNAFGLLDMAGMTVQEAEVFLEEKKVRRRESDLRLLAKAREINDEIVSLTGGSMDYTSDLAEVEEIIRR